MAGEDIKKEPVAVSVPSSDPKKKPKKKDDDLPEEDWIIKENIELLVERLQDPDDEVFGMALKTLTTQLQAATSSMTSVPKPLKYLRPHLNILIKIYTEMSAKNLKKAEFAMILSVVCTTCLDPRRLTLHFCLEAGGKNVKAWGYEYIRNLSGQIAAAYNEIQHGDGGAGFAKALDSIEVAATITEEEKEKVEGEGDGDQGVGNCSKVVDANLSCNMVDAEGDSKASPLLNNGVEAMDVISCKKMSDSPVSEVDYLKNLVVENPSVQSIIDLAKDICLFYMTQNCENEALDLLCEVEALDLIEEFLEMYIPREGMIQEYKFHDQFNNLLRICLYLFAIANYAATYEEYIRTLSVGYRVLLKHKYWLEALRVALRIGDKNKVLDVFSRCDDLSIKYQLAIVVSRQRVDISFEDDEKLERLASGEKRTNFFKFLAKELDVLDPKEPEDVYKTHLEDNQARRPRLAALDSALQNLASTFVNAFVNAGFGVDKLMTVDGSTWMYKNKEHGMLTATASIGAICLWNVDEALGHLDRHQYSSDIHIKAGAILGFGVSSCNVRHECDAALALLKEHFENNQQTNQQSQHQQHLLRLVAVLGLGCAHAGTCRSDVAELLTVVILDGELPLDIVAITCVCLGLCFVGSGDGEAAEAIITAMMDRGSVEGGLDSPLAHFMSLGLGLVFLCTRDLCEPTVQTLETLKSLNFKPSFVAAAIRTVEGMAGATTGEAVKIQKFMAIAAEKRSKDYWARQQQGDETANNATNTSGGSASSTEEDDHEDDLDQSLCVMNVTLVAFSEEIGAEMSLRMMDHILQYGELHQRRAVPLAIALHSPSNPKPQLIDLLSKLSHDPDPDVALNAIFSMGILGAGTNHARLASLLRQLASYYGKDPNALFIVRISQGLLHLGKGLLTLNPIHNDRFLVNPVALGSLIIVAHLCLHMRHTLLGKYHYLLYLLFPAVQPRMLITVHESCHVGKKNSLSTEADRVDGGTAGDKNDDNGCTGMDTDGGKLALLTLSSDGDSNKSNAAPVLTCIGDVDLTPAAVSVRVGEAVEIVGQVGRHPKTITAFQTHTSPVLLNFGERAELASEDYTPLSRVLEGIVILRKKTEASASNS